MIDYYTKLKVDHSMLTDAVFEEIVSAGRELILKTPLQCKDGTEIFPLTDLTDENMISITDKAQSIKILRFGIRYGDAISAQHVWTLDRQRGELTAYADMELPPDVMTLPNFHGNRLFGRLSSMGCVLPDNGCPVSGKPVGITFSTRETAIDLIMREDHYSLPVIYLSVSKDYRYLLDPFVLTSAYEGIAHVMYEVCDSISSNLKYDTYGKNPYRGTIGVFLPKNRRILYLSPGKYTPEQAERKLGYAIRDYMQGIRIPEEISHLAVENGNLVEEKKILESRSAQVLKENQEIYEVFDAELEDSEDRIRKLEKRISQLERENGILKTHLSTVQCPALLRYGTDPERECYPGEYRNIALDILSDSLDACVKGGRREQVVRDILDANGYDGEQRKLKEGIKSLFRKNSSYDTSLAMGLRQYGFSVQRDGCHIILRYHDCPQSMAIAKTPSDNRSMMNLAHNIIRNFL